MTPAQKRNRLLRPPPVQWNDDHGRWESVRPHDAEVLAELERFHATPVASVLRKPNRPPQWEPWEAVQARYRARFAAAKAKERVRSTATSYTSSGFPVGRPRTIPESGPWTCRNGHAWEDVTVATYGRGRRIYCRRCANIATVRSRRERREAARRARRG